MLCSSQKWALRQGPAFASLPIPLTHVITHPLVSLSSTIASSRFRRQAHPMRPAMRPVPQNPDQGGQMVKESGDWGIEREGIEQQKRRRTISIIKEFEGTNYVRRRNEWMKVKIIHLTIFPLIFLRLAVAGIMPCSTKCVLFGIRPAFADAIFSRALLLVFLTNE